MTELLITIPDDIWLTSNQRWHWAAKAKRTAAIRELAAWTARAAQLPRFERVHICAWIGYPTARKADPSNAAPTVKAILDGLTDAGVWPDDDSEHVVAVEYRRDPHPSDRVTHTIRLTLTDQTIPWHPENGSVRSPERPEPQNHTLNHTDVIQARTGPHTRPVTDHERTDR